MTPVTLSDSARQVRLAWGMGVFNIDGNESPRYYVDLFASIVCILSSLVAAAALLSQTVGWTLFISVGVFLSGLLIASRKSIPLTAALLFLGTRFIFAFLISFRLGSLAGALSCLAVAAIIVRQSESN